jgi:hypothetical protein
MTWLTSGLSALGLYANAPTQNQYSQQVQNLAGQAAPQLNGGPQQQFRNDQMQQIGQLQGIASGQQQGAGELAVQRQVANAQAAQQAQARMARGGSNAALAYRGAANNTAGIGLAGAGQSQQAALQDQMNAQQMLGQQLNQGRQQDIGLAGQNAQLQAGQNALGMQGYLGLGGQNLAAQQAAAQQQNALTGGLLNAAGGIAMYSDEDLKENVSDGGKAIDKMLDGIHAKSYRYKDQANGKGQRVGVMAQDMAKSPLGSSAVTHIGPHLALDVNKAVSAALAASARLHERVKSLEGSG